MANLAIHIHTYPHSSCSEMLVTEVIMKARQLGLDGICLTEHNFFWPEEEIKKLNQDDDFIILRGIEVDTDLGHVIAFGVNRTFPGITPITELKEISDSENGFLVAAHPFRGFLMFGSLDLGMTVQKGTEQTIFKYVNAVEAYSGRMNPGEINLSIEVARSLNLTVTGGSDAHRLSEVGRYVTQFSNDIYSEKSLITEMQLGKFSVLTKIYT